MADKSPLFGSRWWLTLALFCLVCLPPYSAHGQSGLVDFIVDNPTSSEELFPWGRGRMASLADRSGFLYRTRGFQDWLYLVDNSGNEAHIRLPDQYSRNDRAEAEYIFSDADNLWVWSGIFGSAKLRHYRLLGAGPLPDKAILVSTTAIGDANSRPAGLIPLASGGFLGVWYQFAYHADRRLELGFIYRPPAGELKVYFPLPVKGAEGNIVASRFSLAQHPADDSIWVFFKRDSYHEISAIHLSETKASLKVDWVLSDFISQRDGLHGPEGEFPYLVAAADRQRKTLRLAYQNRNTQLFYLADSTGRYLKGSCPPPEKGALEPAFFSKGAHLSLAEIAADGSLSFQTFPTYVERTRYFGFSVTDRLWLAFQPVDCSMTSFDSLQRSGKIYLSHYTGRWSKPALLGQLDESKDYYAAPLLFHAQKPEFVMRLRDNKVHHFIGD